MPTKIGFDQHNILHQHFPGDCCLCKVEQELKKIREEIHQNYVRKSKLLTEEEMYQMLHDYGLRIHYNKYEEGIRGLAKALRQAQKEKMNVQTK